MSRLRQKDRNFLDEVFEMGSGYVLNFSDRTFAEFFESELSVDIDDPKYRSNGSSKGKRLRAFLQIESEALVAKALRALWEYRDDVRGPFDTQDETVRHQKDRFFNIVHSIEGAVSLARTDAIDKFADNQTLEELISAIKRDIQANKPEAALDRLHTYCMKKFAYFLDQKGIAFDKDAPLQSRAGKYIKALEGEGRVRDISLKIMKSSISIFDSFNSIRNNESFAHDNEIVEKVEARFVFDAITNILRFMKGFEADRFGQ
jgi:Abortive infection C-terminus